MKTLGVIGGLGPMATAYFLELVTDMTDAACDQEHIHILIDSVPQTPDRTRFILGLSDEDPYPCLIESGRRLVQMGADIIAITCNTAQYFLTQLSSELGVPCVDMIGDTAAYLAARGIKKAGLMATDGSVKTGLYQRVFAEAGIELIAPCAADQSGVMHIIYEDVKKGLPAEMDIFDMAASGLKAAGAEAIVLGCTELSVVKRDNVLGSGFIESMQVMAASAITMCGAKIKEKYNDLLTD